MMEKSTRAGMERKKRPWECRHPVLLTQKDLEGLEERKVFIGSVMGAPGWDAT